MNRGVPLLIALLGLLGPRCACAQEADPEPQAEPSDPEGPFADPKDPFASPEDPFASPEDPFASPEDPFASPEDPFAASASSTPAFDPNAVAPVTASGFELHGRANVTLASTRPREPIELFEDDSIELSSLDVYAQWFPFTWFGVLAELEVEDELEDMTRELEVDPELVLLEFRPLSDERLRLRAGYAPIPFGLERRYYAPPRNELANRPAVFRRLFPGTYSDLGVFAWGTLDTPFWGGFLELEAGVFRGLTGPGREDVPEFADADTNDEPQASGRLAWTVIDGDPTFKGATGLVADLPTRLRLTIGGSVLFGHYDDAARRRLLFHGVDAELEFGGLRLRCEYVGRWFEVPGAPDVIGDGYYTLISYTHRFTLPGLEELTVAFRHGRVDPDHDVRDDLDVTRYHLGLGWVPYEGFLVKAGFEYAEARSITPKTVYLEIGYSF